MLNVNRRLPLLAAVAGFFLYAATMGHQITIPTLPLAARLAGWDNVPLVGQPLVWLLTLPLRLLPATWVPLVVKLLSAAIAGAILGLLTRTVQLLPWDRPWDNAPRFAALLPALAAWAVCGLEFSFWQEATSTCGELLDQLLLAGAIWLLLEFNVRQNTRWLDAAVVVWGLGMAQNWVMLMALPLFLIALIWLLRLEFFRWDVLLRLTGLGLAGFSIYIVLPMANGLWPHSPWTLHQSWHASLRETKSILMLVYYQFWRGHRLLTLAVVIYYLVPSLPLLVRMRDEGTHNKLGVDRFQIWLYRSLRVGLLLACLWLAFDPVIAARQMVLVQMGLWMPMLTLDYLDALGVAFLLGNLLLIAQPASAREDYYRPRPPSRWRRFAVPASSAGLALVVAGLAARNAPAIWRLNFHPIEEVGTLAVNSLPSGGHGVVLSDFPEELVVFQAALAHSPKAQDWLPVDTHALATAEYRARLQRLQPGAGWLTDTNSTDLDMLQLRRLLEKAARTNRLFYLHPSFGFFFERFRLEPSGTVYEMMPRGKDLVDTSPMPSAAIDAGEQFWTSVWDRDLAQLAQPAGRRSGFQARMALYGLVPAPRSQDRVMANWCSMLLDDWGVRLQRSGRLSEARVRLVEALRLNTNNVSARFTLLTNTNLQTGVKMTLVEVRKAAAELGNLDRLSVIIGSGGPFDDPTAGFLLGSSYLDHSYLVQAAEQFERVHALIPGDLAPELALAQVYDQLQLAGRSRVVIDHLREETRNRPPNTYLDLDVALLDYSSWLLETNVDKARAALRAVVAQHPDDPQVIMRVLAAYASFGDMTNALRLADAQLAKTPNDVTSLNNKAILLMQSGRSAEAIDIFDHVLALTNLPVARINRAYAHLNLKDFALAESDFRKLEKDGDATPVVHFGMAVVAENSHDTNQAIHYLQLCLTNSPMGSPLWRQTLAHLHALQPSKPLQ